MLLKINNSRICKHSQRSKYFKAKIFADNPQNREINEKFSPSKYLGYRPCAYQGVVWQKPEKSCYGFKFHDSLREK